MLQSPNQGKAQHRLDYILTRQDDRRLVRNIAVRTPPKESAESDHNLVFGNICLLGRVAPNQGEKGGKNQPAFGLWRWMTDSDLRSDLNKEIAKKLVSPLLGTGTSSVDD